MLSVFSYSTAAEASRTLFIPFILFLENGFVIGIRNNQFCDLKV